MSIDSKSENWLPIIYREFYDIPRVFIVEYNELLLFDCPFSDELDGYPNEYFVYVLNPSARETLGEDWGKLKKKVLRYLGQVRLSDVEFDETRRHAINSATIDRIRLAT